MSGAQKLALSLLIAVVVFSGFTVFAWSGLFDFIETTFYLQRIEENVDGRLHRASEAIARYHKTNIGRFQNVLAADAVRRVFSVNQSQADNRDRDSYFVQLEAQLPGLGYVRFIDLQGLRLHFSTNRDDFTETETARQYSPVPEISPLEEIPLDYFAYGLETATIDLASASLEPDILVAPGSNQFVYRLPSVDEFGILQGSALFYVHTSGLVSALVRDNIVGLGYDVDLVQAPGATPDETVGIIVNARPTWGGQIAEQIVGNWDVVESGERPVLTVELPQTLDGGPETTAFLPFAGYVDDPVAKASLAIYLLPEYEVRMTDVMRIAVLAAIFLTSFLLVYLLLNLRQDAVVVLSDRVKRFQIHLLREYMESKEDMDFQRWRAELEDRREEVAKEIRRGIGRVRPAQNDEVDKLINNSWDEILEVLSGRGAPATTKELDLDRLEDIVERVVGNFQNMPVVPSVRSPSLTRPETVPSAGPARGGPVEVEEVDELEAAGEEELGDVEELGEPVEVEEVDELEVEGDIEELSELGSGEGVVETIPATDGDDEAAELDWLAESETLDVEETTLEDLEDEILRHDALSAAGTGLEEAETVEDLIDDEVVAETHEVDYWPDEGEAELVEELEESEAVVDEVVADLVEVDEAEEIEVLEEAEDEGQSALEGELEQVKSGASPFMRGMFSFGPGISVRPVRRQERVSDFDAGSQTEKIQAAHEIAELQPPERSQELVPLEEIGGPEETAELTSTGDVADLEEIEPLDEGLLDQEVEEIGGPEEVPEPAPAPDGRSRSPIVAGSSIRFTELRELVTPEYEIATVISVLDRLHVDKNIIVDSEGMIEIDRLAYADARMGHDDEMKGLVESVMGEPTEEVQTGVEQIFARGEIDLLSPPDSEVPEVRRRRDEPGTSLFRFIDRGFDYDAFLRGFRQNEGGTIESLVSFTRLWGAQVGILYEQERDDLHPRFALGVEESCWQSLIISGSSGICRNVLAKRHVLYLDQPLRHVEYFNGLCGDEQISFFVKSLFLPVVINGNDGYALLGFRDDVEDVTGLFRRIMPQLSRAAATT